MPLEECGLTARVPWGLAAVPTAPWGGQCRLPGRELRLPRLGLGHPLCGAFFTSWRSLTSSRQMGWHSVWGDIIILLLPCPGNEGRLARERDQASEARVLPTSPTAPRCLPCPALGTCVQQLQSLCCPSSPKIAGPPELRQELGRLRFLTDSSSLCLQPRAPRSPCRWARATPSKAAAQALMAWRAPLGVPLTAPGESITLPGCSVPPQIFPPALSEPCVRAWTHPASQGRLHASLCEAPARSLPVLREPWTLSSTGGDNYPAARLQSLNTISALEAQIWPWCV